MVLEPPILIIIQYSCQLIVIFNCYQNMEVQKKVQKHKNSGTKISIIEKFHNTHSLMIDYEDQYLKKEATIKNIKTHSSTLFTETQTTISRSKKITFTYNKSQEMRVTQIVLSQKTKYIIDDQKSQDQKSQHHVVLTQQEKQKDILKIIKEVARIIKNYCSQKEVIIPKQITLQAMNQHSKMYSCILYTISTQFRILDVYSCSLDTLDEYATNDTSKNILSDLILSPYKELMKSEINSNNILKSIFTLLQNPDFPVSRFSNKKKITFLLMLAQALFMKKKNNKKRKDKKKKCQISNEVEGKSFQKKSCSSQSCYQAYAVIERLANQSGRRQICLSSQFISNLDSLSEKRIQ